MKLFQVQDLDRPMYVVAVNWQDAIDKWGAKIREENPWEPDAEVTPEGVNLICDAGDLLLP